MRALKHGYPELAEALLKINLGKIGFIELIDDGYNANPASISSALNTLGKSKAKRRIAILGDMKELGASEIDYHKKIASLPDYI